MSAAGPPAVSHVLLFDFEATCDPEDDNLNRLQQCDRHEIIEFPALLLDARTGAELACFHEYVRPTEAAELSAFCLQLTGITQQQVNSASPLADVVRRFEAWVEERGLTAALNSGAAVLVAHGGWDLGDQLPREAARKGIALPAWLGSSTYADIKVLFGLQLPGASTSLRGMLRALGIEFEGRLHSGIDDCRNLRRVLTTLIERGASLTPTHSHHAMLRGHGAGMRPGDWACSQCVEHNNFASRAMCLRCGALRPVPGSAPAMPIAPVVAAVHQSIMPAAPAPPLRSSRPGPQRRAGDWDCYACGVLVFGTRLACYRCGAVRPAVAARPPVSMYMAARPHPAPPTHMLIMPNLHPMGQPPMPPHVPPRAMHPAMPPTMHPAMPSVPQALHAALSPPIPPPPTQQAVHPAMPPPMRPPMPPVPQAMHPPLPSGAQRMMSQPVHRPAHPAAHPPTHPPPHPATYPPPHPAGPLPPHAASPHRSSGGGRHLRGSPKPTDRRRIGDWDCPKCRALVYSSRSHCYRCGVAHADVMAAATGFVVAPTGGMAAAPVGGFGR